MARTGVESVVRLRHSAAPGRFGALGEPDTLTIDGCTLVPAATGEATFDAATVVTRYTLVCPPGTDLKSSDRLAIRGEEWEVEGDALDWRSKRGKAKAVTATVKRVTG